MSGVGEGPEDDFEDEDDETPVTEWDDVDEVVDDDADNGPLGDEP